MLNPGYTATVRDQKFKADAGPVIRCPKCKKPLMEGVVVKYLARCKHCGKWVYLTKVDKTS